MASAADCRSLSRCCRAACESYNPQDFNVIRHAMTTTYESCLARCTLKLSEKRCLQLATTMVACFIALQHFVHSFKQKRPELVKWPIVTNAVRDVDRIVMIRSDDSWSIQLKHASK